MANQKLTDLTQATTPLSGNELVYLVQGGASKKATAQQLADVPGEWSGETVSQAEAEAGTATTRRAWTAQRVAQAVAAWWAGSTAKTKLDGVQAGATANSSDAQLRDRSTHTGTQDASTITGLGGAAALNVGTTTGTVAAGDDARFHASVTLAASVADVLGLNGQELTADDPGADRLLFWDDSESKLTHLTLGTNLSITGTTLNAAGGSPGGSSGQLQFNDGGSFGGDIDLTYDKTTNLLTTKGDISLDDGGSFTTTLQTVTPTANRTISLPDATGTVALVAGSSGQLLWNNAGVNAGASTLTYDGSILTTSGRFINSYNAAASAPAKAFTGTWFTGGTATTTKPHVLIEPTGTTSTAWSTSGTGLGVNAPSGFAGRIIDLQVNGTSYFQIVPGSNSSTLRLFGASGWDNFIRSKSTAGTGFNIESNLGLVGRLEFGVASGTTGAGDTFVERDAASILAQRNGTNAQTFRVYNTFTSATNFERLNVRWTSNEAIIDTEAGSGGGTLRGLKIGSASTSLLGFYGATPVDQPAAVSDLTTTATTGSLPAANGTVTIADAAAPTNAELLEYCVELEAKLEAALSRFRELGLIAT